MGCGHGHIPFFIQRSTLAIPEVGYRPDDLVHIVGKRQDKVLVYPLFHQVYEQGIEWCGLCPELGIKEHHRTGKTEGKIVVLHSLLEHFLYSSGTSWGIDYASVCYGKEGVFTYAVFKEFGNMCGKG